MSDHRRAHGELVVLVAVGLGVCCVLPVLAGLVGVLGVGVILGPLALGVVATALVAVVVLRGRHRRSSHRDREAPRDDAVEVER